MLLCYRNIIACPFQIISSFPRDHLISSNFKPILLGQNLVPSRPFWLLMAPHASSKVFLGGPEKNHAFNPGD